jgi:hypothetical protein
VADIGDEGSQALFEKLRRLRLDIAQRLGVAPYVVFHDKTLKEMAVVRPSTPAELLGITGVGERKLELYGDLSSARFRGSNPTFQKMMPAGVLRVCCGATHCRLKIKGLVPRRLERNSRTRTSLGPRAKTLS